MLWQGASFLSTISQICLFGKVWRSNKPPEDLLRKLPNRPKRRVRYVVVQCYFVENLGCNRLQKGQSKQANVVVIYCNRSSMLLHLEWTQLAPKQKLNSSLNTTKFHSILNVDVDAPVSMIIQKTSSINYINWYWPSDRIKQMVINSRFVKTSHQALLPSTKDFADPWSAFGVFGKISMYRRIRIHEPIFLNFTKYHLHKSKRIVLCFSKLISDRGYLAVVDALYSDSGNAEGPRRNGVAIIIKVDIRNFVRNFAKQAS